MPRPLKDSVRRVLSKHDRSTKIRSAIYSAWDTIQATYPQRSWFRRKSTVRGLMWEHAISNVIDVLGNAPGVYVLHHFATVSFIFDDAVLLRVKKADIELKTSNYPTALADLFYEHQKDLFGHVGLQRVEAAYVLNQFETDVDWIGVVAQQEDKQLWNFELEDAPAMARIIPPPPPAKRPTSALAKLKKAGIDVKENNKDDQGKE